MTINKNTDLEFSLQQNTEKGGVYTNFYTEDKGSASIRIRLSNQGYYLDLTKIDLKPVLFLFHDDGSIFEIKDFMNVMPEQGLIQYNFSDNVIRHAGKVKAKVFLKSDTKSIHVANFSFDIKDSGIEGAVEKEINVPLLKSTVQKLINENSDLILGEGFKDEVANKFIEYTKTNPEDFKGPQGERGEQGIQGPVGNTGETGAIGPKGDKGDTGPQGIKGDTGAQGPRGDGGTTITDTGKIALTLENGATEFTSSDGCFYRVVTIGTIKYVTLKFRYYASRNNVVIARVPNELSTGTHSYIISSFSSNINLTPNMYIKGTFIYLNANNDSLLNSSNSITAYLTYTI